MNDFLPDAAPGGAASTETFFSDLGQRFRNSANAALTDMVDSAINRLETAASSDDVV